MRYKIPIKIIELESDNYHLLVFSEFQDGTKVNWVIDTGASKTVFDKNLEGYFVTSEDELEELHSAGINDEIIKTSVGYVNPFFIGNLKVEQMKVALLDMAHINELYSKAVDLQICGLIGSDFLLKYKAVIDYKRKRLLLSANALTI
ncbi:retropepsin-like aspartic protease [Prolixibacteraceae bacterium Z1-6]|uniref:Retropepsin-like aspartic protease n=1 Tax=Draconibacterium aestuarii TaxID=2998507 RepID=A0A9X3F967_9BACT|nr:retropepsin-like aspartic protease [Prolixibacteraceae bacterium Z1-6]